MQFFTDQFFCGNAETVLQKIPDCSVDACITSPPYYLQRDYGVSDQIGVEDSPEAYIDSLTSVFAQVRRVLKDNGTLWVIIGDSYVGIRPLGSGYKKKDLIGIPWMLAFALRADGWYLRDDIIWHKTNPMPESVRDRCTRAHEYIFLLSKSPTYYYDAEAISVPTAQSTVKRLAQNIDAQQGSARVAQKNGNMKAKAPKWRYGGKKYSETPDVFFRTKSGVLYDYRLKVNRRDVWTSATAHYKDAHFATFPAELIRPCVLASCPVGGLVLDPFVGSGTTAEVALETSRHFVGIDINPSYVGIAKSRVSPLVEQPRLPHFTYQG